MKMRKGFVSNSSSSSFVIVHYKKLETDKDFDNLIPKCINSFRYPFYNKEKDITDWVVLSREDVAKELKISLKEATPEEAINCVPDTLDVLKRHDKDLTDEATVKLLKDMFICYLCHFGDEGGGLGGLYEHDIIPLIADAVESNH